MHLYANCGIGCCAIFLEVLEPGSWITLPAKTRSPMPSRKSFPQPCLLPSPNSHSMLKLLSDQEVFSTKVLHKREMVDLQDPGMTRHGGTTAKPAKKLFSPDIETIWSDRPEPSGDGQSPQGTPALCKRSLTMLSGLPVRALASLQHPLKEKPTEPSDFGQIPNKPMPNHKHGFHANRGQPVTKTTEHPSAFGPV